MTLETLESQAETRGFLLIPGFINATEVQEVSRVLRKFPKVTLQVESSVQDEDPATSLVYMHNRLLAFRDRISGFTDKALLNIVHYYNLRCETFIQTLGDGAPNLQHALEVLAAMDQSATPELLAWYCEQIPDTKEPDKMFWWEDMSVNPLYTQLPLNKYNFVPIIFSLRVHGLYSLEFVQCVYDQTGIVPRMTETAARRVKRRHPELRKWCESLGLL